jgi:hypothetical protein
MDKLKTAEDFLRRLQQTVFTANLMSERLDEDTLKAICKYSFLITRVKDNIKLNERDLINCSIIIGYLLKSHMDRVELDELLNP